MARAEPTPVERGRAACRDGRHGMLLFDEPRTLGGVCVTRDVICHRCGSVVATETWRMDAWTHRGQFQRYPGQEG